MKKLPVPNPFFNAPVYFLKETVSTMDEAAALIRENPVSGTVITAAFQSGGRGRGAERIWVSAPGENLLFTLLLHKDDLFGSPSGLSLRFGLGLALCLEEDFGLHPRIKWPNDLLFEGGKIAGILCQGRGDWFLAGMGLNLLPPGGDSFRRAPASMKDITGKRILPENMLELLLPRLYQGLSLGEWKDEVEMRLYGLGESVRVAAGSVDHWQEYSARLAGLDGDGALLLEVPGKGLQPLYAGEITAYESEEQL